MNFNSVTRPVFRIEIEGISSERFSSFFSTVFRDNSRRDIKTSGKLLRDSETHVLTASLNFEQQKNDGTAGIKCAGKCESYRTL